MIQLLVHLPLSFEPQTINVHPYQSIYNLTHTFNLPTDTQWIYGGHQCNPASSFIHTIQPNDPLPCFYTKRPRFGGFNPPWYIIVIMIIIFILYILLMLNGFISVLAQAVRIIFQQGIHYILKGFQYLLGPENPIAYSLGKIFVWIQPFFLLSTRNL